MSEGDEDRRSLRLKSKKPKSYKLVDESDSDLTSEESNSSLEPNSDEEMGPKVAEKGRLKGEVQALLVEVEEELAYDEDGADRVEVEVILKSLKEL